MTAGNINPGSVASGLVVHHAARVPGPTDCGASGTPCPASEEFRWVTCPKCLELATPEQREVRAAQERRYPSST